MKYVLLFGLVLLAGCLGTDKMVEERTEADGIIEFHVSVWNEEELYNLIESYGLKPMDNITLETSEYISKRALIKDYEIYINNHHFSSSRESEQGYMSTPFESYYPPS